MHHNLLYFRLYCGSSITAAALYSLKAVPDNGGIPIGTALFKILSQFVLFCHITFSAGVMSYHWKEVGNGFTLGPGMLLCSGSWGWFD